MFNVLIGLWFVLLSIVWNSPFYFQECPNGTPYDSSSFNQSNNMGCRRDVPERETANTNINPRILLYCVDIKNKMAFKRQLLTLFPQYLFILMFKMQFKACFKFCLIYFFEWGFKVRFKCVLNPCLKCHCKW